MNTTNHSSPDDAPPPRWFPMYIGDEVMDTKGLSIETRGALYSLSLHYFHKGGLPTDDRMVQKIADVPDSEMARRRKRTQDHIHA